MVSTRHHPKEFPEPSTPSSSTPSKTSSPAKASSSPAKATTTVTSSSSSPTANSSTSSTTTSSTTAGSLAKTPTRTRSTATASSAIPGYVHNPPRILIVWLLVSLPLILWDTLYVLLRPHTMPGGALHAPIWTPYALYGTIDYMYGWPAWNARIGFTAAQGSLNAIEFAMDVFYLWVVYANGKVKRVEKKDVRWFVWEEGKKVEGAGLAVLVVWAAAVMTLSKTVLYWLNEAFSGFDNIGHNSIATLIPLWIIPNGAWIVFPCYIIYVIGLEIWAALDAAGAKKSR